MMEYEAFYAKQIVLENFYNVYSKHFVTDGWETHPTIVKALNKADAMEKFNTLVEEHKTHQLTPTKCKSISFVHEVKYLK